MEAGKGPGGRNRKGTPQGGVISPLLANLFLHWFDWLFYRKGPGAKGQTRLIRYVDDFLVMSPRWSNYFRFGYPRPAFRQLNYHVRKRLARHLKRRSQQPFRPPGGVTLYGHLQGLGLHYL